MTRVRSLLRRAARGGWRFVSRRATGGGAALVSGAVDQPRPLQPYLHWVQVSGWAAAHDGGSVRIEIRSGSRLLASVAPPARAAGASTHTPPAGLAPAVPSTPPAERTAFDVTIPAAALRRALAVVRVEAVTSRGARRTLAVVPVVRSHGRGLGLPRFAYGKVWDRSAPTLADARSAVAGSEDEAEWHRSGASTADHVAARAGISAADVVLEIGCGAGRVGTKLAPRCGQWIGADVSGNMLGYARAALESAGARNVSLVQLNGVDLAPIGTATVDVVYCTAVFMHLDEWDRFRYIVEAGRVLKPGGRLYVDNFDLGSPAGWQLFEQMYRVDPAARPANISKSSTGEELRIYAEKAGFEEVQLERGALFVTLTARRP